MTFDENRTIVQFQGRNGCRRYFTIERNTATNEIRDSEAS